MQIQPYIFFDGRCEEALEFYRTSLGAEIVTMMRWKESPEQGSCPAGSEDKIMHAEFRIGDSAIMASDGRGENKVAFEGFALTLIVSSDTDAELFFSALAGGGKIQMPLAKTFFASLFGMVADRFGVSWMVYVDGEVGK